MALEERSGGKVHAMSDTGGEIFGDGISRLDVLHANHNQHVSHSLDVSCLQLPTDSKGREAFIRLFSDVRRADKGHKPGFHYPS